MQLLSSACVFNQCYETLMTTNLVCVDYFWSLPPGSSWLLLFIYLFFNLYVGTPKAVSELAFFFFFFFFFFL